MNHDAEKEPSLFECNKVDAAKNGGPTFLVPECDSSRELAAFAGELEEAIAQKPQKIILNFVGMMTMSSDAVLLLHDVLCQRSPETKLVVKARSPLQGSAILLWLAGDERHIRPTAWMRFEIKKPMRRRRFPRDEFGVDWWEQEAGEGGAEVASPNAQAILKLMDRYIPVRQLSGCMLTPHILGEYRLLDHCASTIS